MSNIIFNFNGKETKVQCNVNEKMEEIFKRYSSKMEIDINKIYFVYNGEIINKDLTFSQLANEIDKKRNISNILVVEINKTNENIKLIKSNEIICPQCKENVLINFKGYKINLINCKNGHNTNDLSFEDYDNSQNIDISKIICEFCKEKNKGDTYNNEFYKCNTCDKNICPLCKTKHDTKHKIVNDSLKNFFCKKDNLNYINYCNKCNENLCMKCIQGHKGHDSIYLAELLPNEDDILRALIEFKKYIDQFKDNINDIIKKIMKVEENVEIFYNMINNIIKNYNVQYVNYQTLKNINECLKYKDIIKKDINKIINSDNINIKFNEIMNLYNKINTEITNNNKKNNTESSKKLKNKENYKINDYNRYLNKINHKFKKSPKDLTYLYNVSISNDGVNGINDIFEVFISYKDIKEYIISPNIYNYNLDVFTLSDNKKVLSLHGHKNNITTVRYFINNKDHNEYLISADKNQKVIIWDITKNYNIKYEIYTKYNDGDIYSCLLIFPHSNDNNFIITSTSNNSNYTDKSATKIYSLNNGNYINFYKNTNNNCIWYLLPWYDKKGNKDYIIELSFQKIIINNLLDLSSFFELKNNKRSNYYSGFLFDKNNNDYLCCSSKDGFIEIWNLYKKEIFKSINTNSGNNLFNLYHIIKWNDDNIIVSTYSNKTFKIIDINTNEIFSNIKVQHTGNVKCIKKILHPTYGESLLTADSEKTIKLWKI